MLLREPPVNSVAYHESIKIAFHRKAGRSLRNAHSFHSVFAEKLTVDVYLSVSLSLFYIYVYCASVEQLQWVVVGETC